MSKFLKMSISIMLVMLFVLMVLAGCGADKQAEEPKKDSAPAATEEKKDTTEKKIEKVTINYWNGFTGPDREPLEELVKKFNDEGNVEVKLDIMSWEVMYQKLAAALAGGQGPDIFACNTERIGTYAKSNAIVPVEDFYGNGLDMNVVPKGLAENLVYDGKTYGVPVNLATLMMYYNKDLFKAAGLDPESPPKNWDELKDMAVKLTKVSGGKVEQYGFGIATKETIPMWPILIWANGGDFIDTGSMKSVFNSPKTVEAVEIWADLIINKNISPAVLTGAEVDKLFETQKCAMYMCGPWAVGGFQKAGINFGVAPVPAGPAKEVTLGTSVSMYMTKDSKNKEAVYEFFKYWNSKETQVAFSLATGFPPTRTDLLEDAKLKENPYVLAFSSVSNSSQFYLQKLTNFGKIDSDVIVPTMESILLKKSSAKDALDKGAEQMDQLLKEQ